MPNTTGDWASGRLVPGRVPCVVGTRTKSMLLATWPSHLPENCPARCRRAPPDAGGRIAAIVEIVLRLPDTPARRSPRIAVACPYVGDSSGVLARRRWAAEARNFGPPTWVDRPSDDVRRRDARGRSLPWIDGTERRWNWHHWHDARQSD